jgi:hypothetical protein
MSWNQFIAFLAHRRLGESMGQLYRVGLAHSIRERIVHGSAYLTRTGDAARYEWANDRAELAEVVSMVKWARERGQAHRVPTDEQLPALAAMNYSSRIVRRQVAQPEWAAA